MDSHLSHIIVNIIAFCIQNVINLFIMPPHYLHLFQFLDVDVFAPLKYVLNKETNAINQYDSSCISCISWVKMYIKTHIKTLFTENLKAGWKKIELILLNPNKIFSKLFNCKKSILNQSQTPLE